MTEISKSDKKYIEGYANALQDIMLKLTGDNTNGKSYDPVSFEEGYLWSYAFDLKEGGRKHDLKDFEDIKEITDLMLKEAVEWIKD